MNLAASLLGYRRFSSETEILQKVRDRDSASRNAPPERTRSLLIFATSKQHTWLVFDGERLHVILDDVRRPEPKVLHAVARRNLKTRPDGGIAVSTRPKSANTGLVDIGLGRRRWLYSTRLFGDRSIEQAVNGQLFTEPDVPTASARQTDPVTH